MCRIRSLFFILLIFAFVFNLNAEKISIDDTIPEQEFLIDDPIVAMLDSMANLKLWCSYEFITDT